MHRARFGLSFSFGFGVGEGFSFEGFVFVVEHLLMKAEQGSSEFIGVDLGMLNGQVPNFSKFIGFKAPKDRLAIKLANSMVGMKGYTEACSAEGIRRDEG